jgi:uncharacterized membrane protein YraQ (UPF0718 family)
MKQEVHSCCLVKKKPWYKEPLYLILIVIGGVLIVNWWLVRSGIEVLVPVIAKFFGYFGRAWWAILLGLVIGGLVDILVPEELMVRLLARGKKSIFLAVGLGFLASACSHGILAISMSLYKKGASTAATLAFLLAAPWANLAITLLLFSLFGIKALLIIGGAILVAVVSGFVFQFLENKGMIESGKKVVIKEKIIWAWPGLNKLVSDLNRSIWSLTKMVVWWVLLGFLISSFLGAYVPEAFFHRYFGPTFAGLLATLALASIIEVCSEGSAPMAFELFEKTRAFGNTFIFLQAGVITDFTEFGIVWSNIGKRAAIALVSVTVPLTLLLGFLFNNLVY